jgi:hypothetical protein
VRLTAQDALVGWYAISYGIFAGTGWGDTAWAVANKAIYTPVVIQRPTTIKKLGWHNGTTVSGNVDAGIYDVAGIRLTSTGSTAQAGAAALQIVDITDILIGPGLFYFALAADNTTARLVSASLPSVIAGSVMGFREQTSAFVLPATATFATLTSSQAAAVFGLTIVGP